MNYAYTKKIDPRVYIYLYNSFIIYELLTFLVFYNSDIYRLLLHNKKKKENFTRNPEFIWLKDDHGIQYLLKSKTVYFTNCPSLKKVFFGTVSVKS